MGIFTIPSLRSLETTKAKDHRSPWKGAEEPAGIKIPLIDVLPNVSQAVENLALPFFGEDALNLKLFSKLRATLERNRHEMGDVMPSKAKGEPREIVRGYLRDTVFEELFDVEIPFDIPLLPDA